MSGRNCDHSGMEKVHLRREFVDVGRVDLRQWAVAVSAEVAVVGQPVAWFRDSGLRRNRSRPAARGCGAEPCASGVHSAQAAQEGEEILEFLAGAFTAASATISPP